MRLHTIATVASSFSALVMTAVCADEWSEAGKLIVRLDPFGGHSGMMLVNGGRIARLSMQLALSVFIVFAPLTVGAMDCPKVPPVPTLTAEDLDFQRSWQGVAKPYLSRYAVGSDKEPAYGRGYLDVLNAGGYYYDWVRQVILPLWRAPDAGLFYGWIHSGRVNPDHDASPYALTGAGLVETEYEHSSFIVHEALDDGWLRIRLKPGKNGEAWTHRCHLEIGKAKLAYKGWESFLREHGDWLHFRSPVPHALREQPDVNSPRVTMIGLDHKLALLELQGDWMRVVVEQPDQTCSSMAGRELKRSIHKGWIKWRDDKKGPWVWVYTRGC